MKPCPNCNGLGRRRYDEHEGEEFQCPSCMGTGKFNPAEWTTPNQQKPNRIIVAGGRDFSDIELMEEKLNYLMQKRSPEDTAIISGMANGADTLGTHWAEQHGFEVMRFPADWTMYGKSAGYKRNHEMLAAATGLIAFWDGQSRGTAHMIKIAREAGIKVIVVLY